MAESSSCAATILSRRLTADIKPSMAEVATPATDVPNDRPRPLMGAANAERMACKSVVLSSANTAPLSVTTIPRKVPSMPSITSRPTRYGVSAGPGKPTRSPSTRKRTVFCRVAGTRLSQSLKLCNPGGIVAKVEDKPAVAWR